MNLTMPSGFHEGFARAGTVNQDVLLSEMLTVKSACVHTTSAPGGSQVLSPYTTVRDHYRLFRPGGTCIITTVWLRRHGRINVKVSQLL